MFSAIVLAATLGWLEPASSPGFEELRGYTTVVINHVNAALGTENLPAAVGVPVEPGLLVTMPLDRVQVFDRDVLKLEGGRLSDGSIAPECKSGCSAALYDTFQEAWLETAVEASSFAVEIPSRLVFAVHRDLPASTLVDAAYAASETRPVNPPAMSLLVNSSRAGLRAQPFFLLPPTGLELRPGSAALGLTVDVAPGRYTVKSADARYANRTEIASLEKLAAHVKALKKRFPGKEAVILVPVEGVTVDELLRVTAVFLPQFPRIVLSKGQDVVVP
jgi:hypothetical protein